MNSKPHAVTDAFGLPLWMFLIEGRRSDYIGARALLDTLPPRAKHLVIQGESPWCGLLQFTATNQRSAPT